MLRSVFLKTLRDQRRAILWWVISLLALAGYLAVLYPSIASTPSYNQMLQMWPKEIVASVMGEFPDYSTPEGYMNSTTFFMMVPLLFIAFAAGLGANAIAGEEEHGTLDLLLASPLQRWRLVLDKFAALVVLTVVLGAALWLGLAVGGMAVHMALNLGRLAAVTLSAILLGLAFGALALAVGSTTGKRGLSTALASVVGVVAYLLNSLAPVVQGLQPYRKLSLLYYYIGADPLRNGLNVGHAATLVAVTVVLLVVAILAFQRRDVGV
jgi:ABC-2 type transport system permease protein